MKHSPLVTLIAFFFVLLFFYTGVVKLMEINTFREQMASSPLLDHVAGAMAWALPIGEILLAIVLFVPAWRLKGLYISGIVMSLFTVYVATILLMDSHLSCSCGGIIEDLSLRQHLLFNSACIVLSILGILAYRRMQPTYRFKWGITTGAVFLFVILGWTLFTAFTAPPTVRTGMEGRPMPSFEIQLPDSTIRLNTKDIPTGKTVVLIGFSPTCTHCQHETQEIVSHIGQLKEVMFYFVTPADYKEMINYYYYFGLQKYPNIVMGVDIRDFFFHYFKAPGTPYTVVYDSKKRLKVVIGNRFFIDDLIRAVAE